MKVKDFNIMQIAESGECFRWNKVTDMNYIGIVNGKVCNIVQQNDEVQFTGFTEKEFCEYFDLGRDYSKIKELYKNDDILRKAISFGEGIRILNQDKFETLISFIISANNNIPRIKKSIDKISKKFGKHICEDYYAFPTIDELFNASEEELKECGVGFRAKYIVSTVKDIKNGFDLEEVSKLPIDKCKKELTKLMGVGPKVADCVMLFSMNKIEAFPVDVWIKKIMEELYIKEEVPLKCIEKYAKDKFGEFAGIAQQYLFFYARDNLK